MLENKSISDNCWDKYFAQPLNSGNFVGVFPFEIRISESEVI